MLWVFMGLAGLIWAAKDDASPILLDPRIPADLKRELIGALARELSDDQLDAIAGVLRRSDFPHAAEVFSLRRARRRSPNRVQVPSSAPTPNADPSSQPGRMQAIRALLVGQDDPNVLDAVAQTLELLGEQGLANELLQRVQVLRSPRYGSPPVDAEPTRARGVERPIAVRASRDAAADSTEELEATDGDFDRYDDPENVEDLDVSLDGDRAFEIEHRAAPINGSRAHAAPRDIFELARRELAPDGSESIVTSDEDGGLQ